MKVLNKFSGILFISIILFLNFSCEKETDNPVDANLIVPVKLVTTESPISEGSFSITYGAGDSTPDNHTLKINEITEIEVGHTSGSYYFMGEDDIDGKIELRIESDQIKSYTRKIL